jgi:hypothetical protein
MVEFPNQQCSRDEKETATFYKPTYDYLINKAINLNSKDKEKIKVWLEAANGHISNASINYLISPILDEETKKPIGKLPGEIRDIDLITTVRERNIGEYIGLPYNVTVNVLNADSVLRRDLAVREEVNKLMQQSLINLLNEHFQKISNQEIPEDSEPPNIEKFAKEFIEKWVDDRAIQGKHILELINTINDFDTKRLQSFFYWWCCEEFYTYREILNNEVYTHVLSPLEGFPIYNDEQFVEDFTGFVIKKEITLTKVKALYWNKLTEEEKRYLESLVRDSNGRYVAKGLWLASRVISNNQVSDIDYSLNKEMNFDVTDSSESLTEYTIIWRTQVPIKVRTFVDPLGIEQEEVVGNDYELDPLFDTDIRTEWIEEVYIGKRFGHETSGIYLKPEPCDVQRYDKHTMSPKLPVGGKKGILRNIIQNPIPNRLIPYVIIDRLLCLQQERTIAKYQGYIQVIPQSMLNPDNTGTTNEKLFYIKADNTLIYDDTIVDFNTVAQGFRVIGMPAVENYLKVLIELRDKYKSEALEISNMNSYRLGDVMASTGKGVMQESIYRASLGNVLMITMFNAALERDHIADLEFSKIAYQDDIRSGYFNKKDGKHIYVNANIQEHRESDYGVVVENAKINEEKIKMFRDIAFNASQNGDTDSAIAAVDLDSVPELRQALKEISKANKQFEQAMEDQKNNVQKYVSDQQTAVQESINETTRYVADKNAEATIRAAEIRATDSNVEPDLNINDTNDNAIRQQELNFKRDDSNTKNLLREKQISSTERLANKKLKQSQNKQNKQK